MGSQSKIVKRNHFPKRKIGGRALRKDFVRLESLEARTLFSTYTVNVAGDPSIILAGTYSLRAAVSAVNAHAGADTINFSPTVFPSGSLHVITLTLGQLVLSDTSGATTITGPGAGVVEVSGNHKNRIFQINSGVTASISGLTIANGQAAIGADGRYDGGGIYNRGKLTLANSTLTGNIAAGPTGTSTYASGRGGGIDTTGSLTVQNSNFSSNSAAGAGYTASALGFSGEGGAIYGSSSGPITISGGAMTNNSAKGAAAPTNGGAGGTAFGGAVYAAASLHISSSTLSGNVATGGNAANDGSGNVGGNANGGAIFSATSATLTSSTVTGNKAIGGYGGYYGFNGDGYGGGAFSTGSLTITSSAITKNFATSGVITEFSLGVVGARAAGGGIYAVLNGSTGTALTLNQSTVSGNNVLGGDSRGDYGAGCDALGGGVFTSTATILQSTISGNSAKGGAGDPSDNAPPFHAGTGGTASGGGLVIGNSSTVTDSTIANNTATGGAGGDGSEGAPNNENSAGNGGTAHGGGIAASGTAKIQDSTVSGNATFAGGGGAGYIADPGGHNVAPGKSGTATAGGVFIATGSKITLNNTVVSANKAGAAFSDISGTAVSTSSHNLIGVGGGLTNGVNGNKVGITNPKLSVLGNNGGPTQTMVPLAGSPAINAGLNSLIPSGLTVDQRGLPRIVAGTVDIGAVEVGASISGEVYNDANADGKVGPTEKGLPKWTVYLDLNKDGQLDAGDIKMITDSSGDFTFDGLAPGYYVMRVLPMTGYKATKPSTGVITLTLAVGQSSTGNLFGEMKI